MASVDGEQLREDIGGAVLGLTAPAAVSERLAFDGWTLALEAGRSTIVVTGSAGSDHRRVVEDAANAAEHGLDLLCYRKGVAAAVADPFDEHVAWWPTAEGTHLVASTLLPLRAGMSATAEVRDAQGRIVPPPHRSDRWDESLRHFRASQLATTVRDSYRSLWLAVESLLDFVSPHLTPGGESAWVEGALAAAENVGVDIARELPGWARRGSAPADAFRYFYDSRRNVLFHAKRSRGPLTRRTEEEHRDLERALEALAWLYAELGRHVTGEHRQIGGMTYAGFDLIGDRVEESESVVLLLPDEPTDGETVDELALRAVASAPAYAPPLLRAPGLVTCTADRVRLAGPFLCVSVVAAGAPLLAARFIGMVDATASGRVDVRVRVRLGSMHTRDRFAS